MKSIKDLRENYNLITEKEEHDMNKLTQLVRAGLFDAKKLSALKRAMDKPADKMTAQEKRMMINLLDALMAEVLSDKMVYRKIKQDVMKEAKDYYATPDPRVQRVGYPSQKEAPSVLLLKRKAIRVFPDGQKVALYYAQAIDKYVSIPYNEIGINEEVELDENAGLILKGGLAAGRAALKYGSKYADDAGKAIGKIFRKSADKVDDVAKVTGKAKPKPKVPKPKSGKPTKPKGKNPPKGKDGKGGRVGTATAAAGGAAAGVASSGGGSGGGDTEPKYFTPMSAKLQANLSKAERVGGSEDAYRKRIEIANRKSAEAMSRQTNESVNLDGNMFELNNKEAEKVVALYESLNKTNKKKMVKMMNESSEGLEKVISFAVRQ